MALVAITALWMALLLICFKVFGKREVPLLPAIAINYATACAWGIAVTRPWRIEMPTALLMPALLLGVLFIALFYLTALSSQRAGVAATSVASKMSLVLTVLFAVLFLGERPSTIGWIGIGLALVAVPLASYARGAPGARGAWLMPALLFVGNAAIDITINKVQRDLLTPTTEPLFPILVFAVAGAIGFGALAMRGELRTVLQPKALIGGIVLGSMNYASLYFLVTTLARSGLASSSVFPLLNIGVILISTVIGLALFGDRLRRVQAGGIALAVIAMGLILLA